MSNNFDTDILIIGAGFAGLSVASRLPPDKTLVVDRGEKIDIGAASSLFEKFLKNPTVVNDKLSSVVNAEYLALTSASPKNSIELPLSAMTCNVYTYIQGGISNWWGGYASRISEETFYKKGIIEWPISSSDLNKYLIEAETLMRVHGDTRLTGRGYVGSIPGYQAWSDLLESLFPGAHVTSEAKNISSSPNALQGVCLGNGHCAICSNDAKARPDNSFEPRNLYNGGFKDEVQQR